MMNNPVDETVLSLSEKDMEHESHAIEDLDHSGQDDEEQSSETLQEEHQGMSSIDTDTANQSPSETMNEQEKEDTTITNTNEGTDTVPNKTSQRFHKQGTLVIDGSFVPRTLFDFNPEAPPSPKKKPVVRKKMNRPKETAVSPAVEEKSPIFSQTTMKYLKSSGLHSKRLENLLMKYLGPTSSTLSESEQRAGASHAK